MKQFEIIVTHEGKEKLLVGLKDEGHNKWLEYIWSLDKKDCNGANKLGKLSEITEEGARELGFGWTLPLDDLKDTIFNELNKNNLQGSYSDNILLVLIEKPTNDPT